MSVVEVEHLVRSFVGRRVVDDLSLSIGAGEIYGVLGHNGAGKTTLVRLLCGVIARDAGRVAVLGLDPATHGDAVRARVGVLTESPALDDRFTAQENLAYFAAIAGLSSADASARIAELLAFFELSDRAHHRVEGLSKGMKQKLAIARALVARPALLFLDEPTSGLDPVASHQLYAQMRALAREEGNTIVFTTHRLYEAADLCDRIAILARGRKVIEGTPRDVIASVGGTPPVRVEVDDVARARALLAGLLGPARVRVERDTLVADGVARGDVPPLVSALVGAGLLVFRVAQELPSLDDAYLTLDARARGQP